MSRAYRIRVGETLTRVIRGEDNVSCQLELLPILPTEQMAELLAQQLVADGFDRDGDHLSRQINDVTMDVDVTTGTVTIQAERAVEIRLDKQKEGFIYAENLKDKDVHEEQLRKKLLAEMEQEVDDQQRELVRKATDALEHQLLDIKSSLDRAVNRATAEALKQKAAQLGQIKELTEDAETGSLTIVVEV